MLRPISRGPLAAAAASLLALLAAAALAPGCSGADTNAVAANANNAHAGLPAEPSRRLILCIGVNKFADEKVPELANAEEDATMMCKLLRQAGPETQARSLLLLGEKARRPVIREAITSLIRQAEKPGRARILVYIASHGVAERAPGGPKDPIGPTKLFIVPQDGRFFDVLNTCVGLEEFKALWDSPAEFVGVMVDAGFNASGARSISRKPVDAGQTDGIFATLQTLMEGNGRPGRMLLLAADLNQPNTAHPEKHSSTFALALMDALKGQADGNGNGAVSFGEAREFLSKRVQDAASAAAPQTMRVLASPNAEALDLNTAASANVPDGAPKDDLEE